MAGSDSERLLPLVHPDVILAIQGEAASNPNYTAEQLRRIGYDSVNPAVMDFLSDYAMAIYDQTGSEQMVNAAVHAGLVVYRLLESQAEADRLTKAVE